MSRLADHQWRRRFSSSLESLLEGFYRPALMDASRYWRITGYFTSRSLLQVLEGVEQLVAASPDGLGHGQMRLITGVFLSEPDIAALAAGTPTETVLTDHLSSHFPFKGVEAGGQGDAALGAELLAWLVSRGHLEIRVGLPLIDGRIVNDGAIFHAKEGVIEDNHAQRLGFSGSVNETPNGWTSNFETIQTFCSWKPGGAEAIDELEAGFLRLWENRDLVPAPSPCPRQFASSWPSTNQPQGCLVASNPSSNICPRRSQSPLARSSPTSMNGAALCGAMCSRLLAAVCRELNGSVKAPVPSPPGPINSAPSSAFGSSGRRGC